METIMSNTVARARPAVLRTFGLGVVAASLLIWSGVANAAPAPESFSGLAKKVSPAVVNIASTQEMSQAETQMPELPFQFPEGSPFEKFFKQFQDQNQHGQAQPHKAVGLGSGFVIDPAGYVVTNNHVVKGASDVTVRLDDNSVYPAKIVGTDPQTDLALLKIDAKRPLPALDFGDSDKAEVGDWVMAVGNPFGLGGTVTAGIISARGRNIDAGPYDDFLQIDASINQGNSGGPLFNLDGSVIGVNTAIYSPSGGSVGIGFAIPSNMVKSVVAQLRDNGKVERGWLGVMIQPVTDEIAGALGLDSSDGAIVTGVTPDSPAAQGGVKQGDVIVKFAGQKVDGPRELARQVAEKPAGTKSDVVVWRDRSEKSLTITTGHQPAQEEMAAVESNPTPEGSLHSDALNADLAALTPERRAQYGIDKDVSGVLVLDVKEGSVFEQGLRSGDVIKSVDQTDVNAPSEVNSLVQKAQSDDKKAVLLLVERQGHDLFLGLKLNIA
jgi:serine protease Do